jgi:hypothetical protein
MKLITAILFTIICSSLYSQTTDSVRLKITKTRNERGHTYYWMKDLDNRVGYFTFCPCSPKHRKGDIVLIAKKDLIIEDKPNY